MEVKIPTKKLSNNTNCRCERYFSRQFIRLSITVALLSAATIISTCGLF